MMPPRLTRAHTLRTRQRHLHREADMAPQAKLRGCADSGHTRTLVIPLHFPVKAITCFSGRRKPRLDYFPIIFWVTCLFHYIPCYLHVQNFLKFRLRLPATHCEPLYFCLHTQQTMFSHSPELCSCVFVQNHLPLRTADELYLKGS